MATLAEISERHSVIITPYTATEGPYSYLDEQNEEVRLKPKTVCLLIVWIRCNDTAILDDLAEQGFELATNRFLAPIKTHPFLMPENCKSNRFRFVCKSPARAAA